MLKKDRDSFLALVSGEESLMRAAVADLADRELGHFGEHPISAELVKAHVHELVELWQWEPVEGCREWAVQFITDAGVITPAVEAIVARNLADLACKCLPAVLYLMSTQPERFLHVGETLVPLARHADEEVRWRVAYFISKVKVRSAGMLKALDILKTDSCRMTQVYVRECARDAIH